jgi:PleD family two-component response regulator
MANTRFKALLAIPNFSAARDVGTLLNSQGHAFDITPVQSLETAQHRCASESFDVVLLSLSVLDTKFAGLDDIAAALPNASILVLAFRGEQAEALQAIRHGADDCLMLDDFPMSAISQTVFNVIRRKQLLREIRTAGYEDAATGLYNLDGFKTMAQRLFDSCRQPRSKVYIVTIRVQGTEPNTLAGFAEALRATCRKSELMPAPSISRVDVEEFAVLASADSLGEVQQLLGRCEETFRKFKAKGTEELPWSVAFGMAAYDPEYPATPAVVLERARQNWQAILPPQPEVRVSA